MLTLTMLMAIATGFVIIRRAKGNRSRGRTRSVISISAVLVFNMILGAPAVAQGDSSSPRVPNPCNKVLGERQFFPLPGVLSDELRSLCDKVFDYINREISMACTDAPDVQRPGAGMVGAIDPSQGNGAEGSPYLNYGYAGMVWHVYDDNCLLPKPVTDPMASVDTWVGNQLFNMGKMIVGATSSLHYALYDDRILEPINAKIKRVAEIVFSNVYMQLFGVFMLVLAVMMFRQIWRGDLATVSKRALFALGGMWLAASTPVLVNNYGRIDYAIIKITTEIQAGFVDPDENEVIRDRLPTDLHTKVVYENWLRGEFGSPVAPQANEFGLKLLDAQAWTWDDAPQGKDKEADNNAENAKKAQYKQIAGQLGPATGYFKGTDGSRMGTGFLSLLQAIVYSLFQLFAKLAVLLAQLLLRMLTLTAPIIGLVALIQHDILRRVGKAVGAVVLNVLLLAVLAGVHYKFLLLIFSADAKLSLLVQMLLAAIVTLVFMRVGRPIHRMWQMIDLSIGAAGVTVPTPRGRLFSRSSGPRDGDTSPQSDFWNGLRRSGKGDGPTAAAGPAGHGRPEAGQPATVTARHRDKRHGIADATKALAQKAVQAGAAASSGGTTQAVFVARGAAKTTADNRRDQKEVNTSRTKEMMTMNSSSPADGRDHGRSNDGNDRRRWVHLVYRPSTDRVEPAPRMQPRDTSSNSDRQ